MRHAGSARSGAARGLRAWRRRRAARPARPARFAPAAFAWTRPALSRRNGAPAAALASVAARLPTVERVRLAPTAFAWTRTALFRRSDAAPAALASAAARFPTVRPTTHVPTAPAPRSAPRISDSVPTTLPPSASPCPMVHAVSPPTAAPPVKDVRTTFARNTRARLAPLIATGRVCPLVLLVPRRPARGRSLRRAVGWTRCSLSAGAARRRQRPSCANWTPWIGSTAHPRVGFSPSARLTALALTPILSRSPTNSAPELARRA